MAAGATYTPLATTTLSGVSSYTFTSISTSYTDLVIIGSIAGVSVATDVWTRFGNGSVDTGTNYSWIWMSGNSAGANADKAASVNKLYFDGWGTIGTGNSMMKLQYMNYSNTSVNKTVFMERNDAAKESNLQTGYWRSTSAINTIQIGLDAGTFSAGTTLTLYGIAAA